MARQLRNTALENTVIEGISSVASIIYAPWTNGECVNSMIFNFIAIGIWDGDSEWQPPIPPAKRLSVSGQKFWCSGQIHIVNVCLLGKSPCENLPSTRCTTVYTIRRTTSLRLWKSNASYCKTYKYHRWFSFLKKYCWLQTKCFLILSLSCNDFMCIHRNIKSYL